MAMMLQIGVWVCAHAETFITWVSDIQTGLSSTGRWSMNNIKENTLSLKEKKNDTKARSTGCHSVSLKIWHADLCTHTPSAVHAKAEAQSSVRFCIHQERLIIKIWFCGDFSYRWARYCRVMMVILFHGWVRSCSWLLTVGNRIHWGDQKWAWVCHSSVLKSISLCNSLFHRSIKICDAIS